MSGSLPFRDAPDRGGGRGRGRGRGDGFRGGRGGGQQDFRGGRGGNQQDFRGGRGGGGQQDFRGGRGGGRGGRDAGPVPVFTHPNSVQPRIEPAVHTREDELIKSRPKSTSPSLPARPNYGTQGQRIYLWTNYFRFNIDQSKVFHRHSVAIIGPNGQSDIAKKLAKRVVEIFMEEQSLASTAVTDYRSTILALKKLPTPAEGTKVTYRDEEASAPSENAKQYTVKLTYIDALSMASLLDESTSTQSSSLVADRQRYIQALNVLVGHHPKSRQGIATLTNNRHFELVGQDSQRMSLGAGLQAIRGFFFSVRAATTRLLVNVQVKNMAFYEPGPLEGIAMSFMQVNGRNPRSLLSFLKSLRVEVTHIKKVDRKGKNIPRFKTIHAFATPADGNALDHPPRVAQFGAAPKDVQFWLQDAEPAASSSSSSPASAKKQGKGKAPVASGGRYVTVKDFFQQKYNVRTNDDYPVINVGTVKEPSYLPMTVCVVRAGQAAKAKLSPGQTEAMIRFAVRKPFENATSIVTAGAKMLGFEPNNAHLTHFGTSINPSMITVPARILNSPNVKYQRPSNTVPRQANWNLRDVKLSRSATLNKWTCLRIVPRGYRSPWPDDAAFGASVDKFAEMLGQMGMRCSRKMPGLRVEYPPGNPKGEIDEAIQRLSMDRDRMPEFLLVVLPAVDANVLYNKAKYACDIKHGILNVCITDKNLRKENNQTFANVGLKVNLKLGGVNHHLEPVRLGLISANNTMIMGIDVTHPSPGSSSKAPSVAAVVASIDATLAQWPAELRVQQAREEMVEALGEMVKSRLVLWRSKNKNALPRNILVYRDGVSEGQYQLVLDNELVAIQTACRGVYPAPDTKAGLPHITIVVVGKRHHTRFYATDPNHSDKGNPPNGTVVDRGVTEVANWDFFLQAHAAIQGTARPAHYFVVHDEIFRAQKPQGNLQPADLLEDLTHNLCYLFGRATKAVSLCPPAYYADLACERARCYLADAFAPTSDTASTASGGSEMHSVNLHDRVKNTMFYI